MKVLCVLCALVGAAGAETPRFLVDDEHLQVELQKSPGQPPLRYRSAPTAAIDLDASQYQFPHFKRPPYRPDDINCLQVGMSPKEQYTVSLRKGERLLHLTKSTLKPNGPDIVKFKGFLAGHQVLVGIGVCRAAEFQVAWAGLIDIVSPE
jgi:hypothetical protein